MAGNPPHAGVRFPVTVDGMGLAKPLSLEPDGLMADIGDPSPAASGLDFRLLNQFLIISRAPNMAAAARKMSLSAPAVSQIVRRVETELGVVLFERSSRGIRLTPAGALFQQRARDLVDAETDMLNALAPYHSQLLPKLRVQIASTVANYLAPAIVAELGRSVGEIQIKSGRTGQGARDFLRGEFDLLISSDKLSEISNLDCFRLCRESLIALAPTSVVKDQLNLPWLAANLPLIRFEESTSIERTVDSYLKNHGFDLPRTIECQTPAPIIELIAQGLGWTIATPLAVGSYQALRQKAAHMPLPQPNTMREIYLIANSGRLLDLPATLAGVCREALAREIRSWKGSANAVLAPAVSVDTADITNLHRQRA